MRLNLILQCYDEALYDGESLLPSKCGIKVGNPDNWKSFSICLGCWQEVNLNQGKKTGGHHGKDYIFPTHLFIYSKFQKLRSKLSDCSSK